jgi:CHAT domain-containing protein
MDRGCAAGWMIRSAKLEQAMTDGGNLDAIRAAREELDAVVEEIRAVPGYEDFLAVPTFDDVAVVAAVCPLVYVAAAEPGGLALVVRGTDVTHVPLDGLTAEALRERATAHLEVYAGYQKAPETARERWNTSLDEVTAWLWAEVMRPILSHLDGAAEVVVVAGGLLGLLPLHAAWTPDASQVSGRRYVLDTVSVSYVPNARALAVARHLAAEVPPARLLAVAEPWPVAAARLPNAKYEAMTATAVFPESHATLPGGKATALSFARQAPEASVLHLACHGFAHLASPLESGLLLADRHMTLGRLMELKLRVRLAVLSACETALPGTELPDEVVALPTGLLQAGVAGVVASQWRVPDRATAMLMAEFYRCWRQEQMTPAAALRAAQRWLRDTTNAQKIQRVETALAQHEAWLPPAVAQVFLDGLSFLEPDHRDHSGLHNWAAFAYVGA